jgi:hypothetical protein
MMMNNFENQLDEIRVSLYEQTKNMSSAEIVEATNKNGKKIAEQFGIVITKGESGSGMPEAIAQ